MSNRITQTKRPSWLSLRRDIIQVNIPEQRPSAPPEQHDDYFPVLKALNKRRVQGQIVSITSHKPVCHEWHEVHAVELGYQIHERRVVFALVRFGGE